jgi:polyribonucleotide nucleotidyltransferase
VLISSADEESANQAIEMINHITQEAIIGKIYMGKVKKIMDFGAFVELFPGTEGLVHISQIADRRIRSVTEVLQEGDETLVKVIEIDHQGKIRLSRKEAMMEDGRSAGGH